MADMVDSGFYTFNAWAKQKPMNNGEIFWNVPLGVFNPKMSATEANERLDHVGKITEQGQEDFKRGWDKAKKLYNKQARK